MLCLSILAFGGTSPAQAQPTELPDATADASLTVHKYVLPDTIDPGEEADGSQDVALPSDAKPIANITFTARRAYSLAQIQAQPSYTDQTMENYESVGDIKGGEDYYYLKDEETLTAATDDTGAATFDLAGRQGMYVVSEQPDARIEIASAPFMVSVPMVDPANTDQWLYNVHVYPKNYQIDVDKYILQADGAHAMHVSRNAGQDITFCVTCDIPSDVAYDTQFLMTDKLDWRLTMANPPTELTVTAADETLASENDYTATVTAGTDDDGHDCQILTVDLMPGKDKLKAAFDKSDRAGNSKVTITFIARLNDNATYGSLDNGATFDITNKTGVHTTLDTPRPDVVFAQIVIDKYDANDSSQKLQGARFRIAQTYQDAIEGNWLHHYDENGNNQGVYEVATDKSGVATFTALQVNLFQNTDYYLVETGSPEGYEPFAEPIHVQFDPAARIASDASAPSNNASYYKVEAMTKDIGISNYPVPELPGTGGVEDNRMTIAGISIIAIAALMAAIVILATRRHAPQQL